MKQQLLDIKEECVKAVAAGASSEELENIRIKFLGRKGELTNILRSLSSLDAAQRSEIGALSNAVKEELSSLIDKRLAELSNAEISRDIDSQWLDVTLKNSSGKENTERGRLHPISQLQYEIEDIFTSMGFAILDGPETETDYYNFEALNIPPHHPARDMQDTFWTEDGNLLRTHTSAIQVR